MVFIGLLRAINVGGRNRLPMAELRSVCDSLGWENVRTLLQSGNVVFEASRAKPGVLAEQLADALEQHMKVRLSVLVRTARELEAIVGVDPFPRERSLDPGRVLVVFLDRAPSRSALDRLRANVKGREELYLHGRELYVHYRDGIGRSKLTNALIERTLGTPASARSWSTVTKLADLAGV